MDAYSRLVDFRTFPLQQLEPEAGMELSTGACDGYISSGRACVEEPPSSSPSDPCHSTLASFARRNSHKSERCAASRPDETVESVFSITPPKAEREARRCAWLNKSGKGDCARQSLCSGLQSGLESPLSPPFAPPDAAEFMSRCPFAFLKSISLTLEGQVSKLAILSKAAQAERAEQLREEQNAVLENMKEQIRHLQLCARDMEIAYQYALSPQQPPHAQTQPTAEAFPATIASASRAKTKPALHGAMWSSDANILQMNTASSNSLFDKPLTSSLRAVPLASPFRNATNGAAKETTASEAKSSAVAASFAGSKGHEMAKRGHAQSCGPTNMAKHTIRVITTVDDARNFHNLCSNREDAPPFMQMALQGGAS